ncbi:MAG: hypothetical protein D6744_17210 [Planctomycetota bacterium]|nr:MAG: hypothetical protein D6744_17210 [Planctomycetota bacterium]
MGAAHRVFKNMIIDQAEIDALLAQTNAFVDEVQSDAQSPQAASEPEMNVDTLPPEIKRLLRLRVPVIVELARCRMSLANIRQLSLGRILEFSKPVNDSLEIRVNNRSIGEGEAVKVGENFGLRVTRIRTRSQRITALGA